MSGVAAVSSARVALVLSFTPENGSISTFRGLEIIVIGALGYGTSLVLFIYALRHLGASRTSTYFGATPFIGMFLSIIILGESFTVRLGAASILMLAGIWLILREYHGHEHTHEAFCHEHGHTHDEHHNHNHEGDFFDPHCHEHEHESLTHSHAHAPDLHHFHRH